MKRPEDRFTTVDGHRIRYWQVGDTGSAVVLLHGIACSVAEWENNIEALSANHRVFPLDTLGSGLSDKPDTGPFDAVGLAKSILGFMTAVAIDRAHLVGNSLGGRIALECAALAPERVTSLVLSAPAGVDRTTLFNFRLASVPVLGEILTKPSKFSTRMLWRIAFANPKLVTDALVEEKVALAEQPGAGPAFMKTLRSFVGFRGFLPEGITHLRACMKAIKTPTLAIWGQQDRFLPIAHLEILKAHMPHAESEVLDPCGHVPMIERPSDFNRLALSFIDRHSASS